jgi:predicted Zn-dependent peptidase
MLERYLGDVDPGKPASRGRAPKPQQKVVTRSRKELEQVHLFLGYPSLPQGHADRYAAWVLNTVLGGSMSSRLFQRVREREGLVYSISSGMASYSDAGNFGIYAGTGLAAADRVLTLTTGELRRIMDEPVPEEELQRARDHLKGSLMLSLESTGSRMNHLARQEITLGRQVDLDQTLEKIEAVDAAGVQRLAQAFFSGPAVLSVLGNLKGYRPRVAHLRP